MNSVWVTGFYFFGMLLISFEAYDFIICALQMLIALEDFGKPSTEFKLALHCLHLTGMSNDLVSIRF